MQKIHCPFQQQNHESLKCLQIIDKIILYSICVLNFANAYVKQYIFS